jgi:hypothetical protein
MLQLTHETLHEALRHRFPLGTAVSRSFLRALISLLAPHPTPLLPQSPSCRLATGTLLGAAQAAAACPGSLAAQQLPCTPVRWDGAGRRAPRPLLRWQGDPQEWPLGASVHTTVTTVLHPRLANRPRRATT